jgi:hypothetical protein
MGFLLYILSLLLGSVLFAAGLLFSLVLGFFEVRWITGIKNANKKFLYLAKQVDKFGNAICVDLFNATLIKRSSSYRFGRIEQTISAVLGWNQLTGKLTTTGKILVWILDRFEKDHCLNAVEEDKSYCPSCKTGNS